VFSDFYVAALCNLGFYDMQLIHGAGLATPVVDSNLSQEKSLFLIVRYG